jgi:alpha-glucosidase
MKIIPTAAPKIRPLSFLIGFFLLIQSHFVTGQQQWTLTSPDKNISARVTNENGSLSYTVSYKKTAVIERSPLGIDRDDRAFSSSLKFLGEASATINERYTLLVGKKLQVHNNANELKLTFDGPAKETIQVIFRAYNDGVAFRYHFPSTDKTVHKIIQEKSGFAIPKEAKAWIQPYDLNVRKKPCYETYYENGIAPGTPSPNPAGWAFPALFTVNGHWLLLTEAGLDETYSATHLEDKENNGRYTIRFPEKEEVTSDADPEPVSSFPWTTPWRVIVIGTSLATIQETNLVQHLNPPSKITDTSWIKPGRASWSWWSQGNTTRSYAVQKDYIDFTASMGWEYVLIDAGWPDMTGGTMEELVRYSNAKGVGIFLWYHSGMGREKDSLSMHNLFAFPEERKKEFQRIKSWGVKGVKVDFFDGDKQPVIKRYFDILRDAEAQQIMVNFHGSTLPRGWERTYPHLVSMESVKGAEGYGRQPFCDRAPMHNTILPFTRNVVGSMDYTPVTFTNKGEAIRQTSFGHELALSVVFESGAFHFADRMSSYQALPEDPKEFLKKVPAAWDETRFVTGVPGKYVVIARRKGNDWYIGGINGQNEPQEIACSFPFLKKDATLKVITDGTTAGTFATQSLRTKSKSTKITLQPRGGFVATITSIDGLSQQ